MECNYFSAKSTFVTAHLLGSRMLAVPDGTVSIFKPYKMHCYEFLCLQNSLFKNRLNKLFFNMNLELFFAFKM
jgi:hypothetical protein